MRPKGAGAGAGGGGELPFGAGTPLAAAEVAGSPGSSAGTPGTKRSPEFKPLVRGYKAGRKALGRPCVLLRLVPIN